MLTVFRNLQLNLFFINLKVISEQSRNVEKSKLILIKYIINERVTMSHKGQDMGLVKEMGTEKGETYEGKEVGEGFSMVSPKLTNCKGAPIAVEFQGFLEP
uniref:ATP phosphoribosyltransferase regulatory subunit n=1 Tax=Lygus hesperus TaxID=30085 RepID=A0A0A9XNS2_LYGHE